MVTSMTGYGSAEEAVGEERLNIEMKSVNHRFLEIQFQLPAALRAREEEARKIVNDKVARGKVEIIVTHTGGLGRKKSVRTDWDLVQQYLQEARHFQHLDAFDGKLSLSDFLLDPNIVSIHEETTENDEAARAFMRALETASRRLTEMRSEEGQLLLEDVNSRLQHISQSLEALHEHIPRVQKRYQERLEKRMKALAENVDEERLLTEVAAFAEKSDVTEELVRLKSHVKQFRETLADTGPIGRKLDFITQEMSREVNTIGAKGNDQELSKLVIEIKSALEKVKEQVQNIE
ncbi:YicC/YloC family endoribonuclease [Natribacillus halophilus]|uniref:TIGR00255 family protein n=1 Tax=Natribacillus halophilus TaxID=549003 RepID=A0A1G8MHD3_9BACI|nr:YicC/YloC family endoribonuclease [Natribacillus halophilus]SDI67306.1 TIGR00255 family protein [Natribacillus halophilus]